MTCSFCEGPTWHVLTIDEEMTVNQFKEALRVAIAQLDEFPEHKSGKVKIGPFMRVSTTAMRIVLPSITPKITYS